MVYLDYAATSPLLPEVIKAMHEAEQKYYANRSLMHCNLNDFANAKKDAEKAIELNPGVAKSYLRLGKACFGQLDYIGAYSAYMAGLEIEPQNNNLIEEKNSNKNVYVYEGDTAESIAKKLAEENNMDIDTQRKIENIINEKLVEHVSKRKE